MEDREQMKQRILELFEPGRITYFSDLAAELKVELPLVVELCQDLAKAGKLEAMAAGAILKPTS